MKREDLFESMEHIDSRILEWSQRPGPRRSKPVWMAAVAAVLVVVLVAGVFLWPKGTPFGVQAGALAIAAYPELAPYPHQEEYYNEDTGEFDSAGYEKAYDAYYESQNTLKQEEGFADGLDEFFEKSIPVFLAGKEGENAAYSPLNVYIALAMLAELTDGESRQQILELLGTDTLEASRQQAHDVWQGSYQDDGVTSTILASSLWLREGVSYQQETLDLLAQEYYASAFQGTMGDEAYNEQLRDWLNEQTGGLLEEQVDSIALKPEDVLALVTTLYFQAGWDEKFSKSDTKPQIFHGPEGDVEKEFLSQQTMGSYYRGENFGAVGKEMSEGTMWLILPDEGVTPEQLVQEGRAVNFLLEEPWEDCESRTVNLAMPKFDISSQTDLLEGMKALGVTDVMDLSKSDFTPMTSEMKELCLTQAEHSVRVAVDEEGVTAAAYSMMVVSETGAWVAEELDFVLDRPFLFAITNPEGLVLFVGIVNQP